MNCELLDTALSNIDCRLNNSSLGGVVISPMAEAVATAVLTLVISIVILANTNILTNVLSNIRNIL
jgi:hypothetical protein